MPRFAFASLFVLLGGVLLGQLILRDKGYILIAFGGWAWESSVWAGLLIFFFFTAVILLLYRLVFNFFRLPHRMDRWWRMRKKHRTESRHVENLLRLASGDLETFKISESFFENSQKRLPELIVAYETALMFAKHDEAAIRINEIKETGTGLAPVQEKILLDMMSARVSAARGDYAHAFPVLQKYLDHGKRNHYIYKLFCEVCIGGKMWEPLGKVLTEGKDFLSEDLQLRYYRLYFEGCENSKRLNFIWQKLKPTFKKTLFTFYVRQLLRTGDDDLAEKLVRDALEKRVSDELVFLYGQIRSSRGIKQLHFLETLAEKHPGQQTERAMLSALAELCLRNKMWALANNRYERLIKQHRISLEEILPGLRTILKEGSKNERSKAVTLITATLPEFAG